MTSQEEATFKRDLVAEAEKIAQSAVSASRGQNQTSQLRNLIQIAQTETEIPVLTNFLRYQAGRTATNKFWWPIHESMIATFETIGSRTPDGSPARKQALLRFFGYLVRQYVYLLEVEKKGRDASRGPQAPRGPQGGRHDRH